MRPYLIIDVSGSLYYHHKRSQNGGRQWGELSDSSGNLSVFSDEDFEVFSSSEDFVRKDELEIEHDSAVLRLLFFRGPELHLKFPTNSDLKKKQSENTLWHRPSMGVAGS